MPILIYIFLRQNIATNPSDAATGKAIVGNAGIDVEKLLITFMISDNLLIHPKKNYM
jgi:hypothetical protein